MFFDKIRLSKMNCIFFGPDTKRLYRKSLVEEQIEIRNIYCQIHADILNKMQFTGKPIEVSIKNTIVSIFQSLLSLRVYLAQLMNENLFVEFQESKSSEFFSESFNKIFPYNNYLLLSLLDDNVRKTYVCELNKFKHPDFNSNIFIQLNVIFKKIEWVVTKDILALWHKTLKEMQWIQIRYLAIYAKLEDNILFICKKSDYKLEDLRNWKLQILRLLFTRTREHPDFKKSSWSSFYFRDLSIIRDSFKDPTFGTVLTIDTLLNNKQAQTLTKVKDQMENKDLSETTEQDFSIACGEDNFKKIKKDFKEHHDSQELSSPDVKILSTIPDKTDQEFQKQVIYFSTARKNKFTEIESMLITCKELSEKFEIGTNDISTLKILNELSVLRDRFDHFLTKLKEIYEFTSKKHLSSKKSLNKYRKLRKEHRKTIKKIALIEPDISKVKNQLESIVDDHLKQSQINITRESNKEHSTSEGQVKFPLISDKHDSQLEVLNNSIFDEKKNSENYFQFFQPSLPQINNTSGLLTFSDHYVFINAKILAISNYCQYDFSYFKHIFFERNIMMNLQVDAILFEVMQLMEKKNRPLIRDGIVHCKGIIEFDLNFDNLENFHKDVMILAEILILSIQDDNYSTLQENSFYKMLLSHGMQLEIQKSTGKKQQVTLDERCHYTMTLANKRFLYETIGQSVGIYTEEMLSSALRLVNIHAHVYGLINNSEVNSKAAREDRHFSNNFSFS